MYVMLYVDICICHVIYCYTLECVNLRKSFRIECDQISIRISNRISKDTFKFLEEIQSSNFTMNLTIYY